MSELVKVIVSPDEDIRGRSLESCCHGKSVDFLLAECESLENLRKQESNLYFSVRALFFLHAIHRYYLPKHTLDDKPRIPFEAYEHLLNRRFDESIEHLLRQQKHHGPNYGLSSALAEAYKKLAFQILADQVRKSVRSTLGNQWMFRTGHPADHPLKINPSLLKVDESTGLYPILHEETPVRMDVSHSGWSDIFFLGMDYPEGARVMNISIDLCLRKDGSSPRPPIETFVRVIEEPVLRLTSVDLGVTADVKNINEVFDFAKDYLGLVKAAVIASGVIPPAMEGADFSMESLFGRLIGPGKGLEVVSQVNNIPKGSRLAVSTNLLASLVSLLMRATGQAKNLTGQLEEEERRLVAARAILGEWIGGSGGGWQDSGGVWPGIKIIEGMVAEPGDPEYKVSKGRLLPVHTILSEMDVDRETRQKLQDSLVLVHGGMAQDVGPILEMVTEKYLLRSEEAWKARKTAIDYYHILVDKLKHGDIRGLGNYTHKNFFGPIQDIIPWATNIFTEKIIEGVTAKFGKDFWGFWMLGGMAGGGMGFIFDPKQKINAQNYLAELMLKLKNELDRSIPFAMDPVVYDFSINEHGTTACLYQGAKALLPTGYYAIRVPSVLKNEMRTIPIVQRKELEQLGVACKRDSSYAGFVSTLFDRMIPQANGKTTDKISLKKLLEIHGFDPVFHNQIKNDLRSGKIGLAQNRLPVNIKVTDVLPGDVEKNKLDEEGPCRNIGLQALRNQQLAVVSLAGGAGSRWTKGAGVVKSLNAFAKIRGSHRNFVEAHLAKSKRISAMCGNDMPHVFTTSYLTHQAIDYALKLNNNYNYPGEIFLSPGQVIGQRLIPMERDLRFEWEERPRQLLDEQQQKVQESLHNALIGWAKSQGEGANYTDNLPQQCIHPVGHWYEVPNLLLNGTLDELIKKYSDLKYLLVHNIDTLGVNADPVMLGKHINSGAALTVEVITRKIEDRGGGLARIDNHLRLIEGMALTDEAMEFDLSYYNSGTTWVDIDQLLEVLELSRASLGDKQQVQNAVRNMARRMPTYITLKDVKKRWGKGQEDIYPVTQFEKLWGDMTALPELNCHYMEVDRMRGQQLKEVDQLDSWLRDGSASYLDSLCAW